MDQRLIGQSTNGTIHLARVARAVPPVLYARWCSFTLDLKFPYLQPTTASAPTCKRCLAHVYPNNTFRSIPRT